MTTLTPHVPDHGAMTGGRVPRFRALRVVTWTTVMAVAVATGLAILDVVGLLIRRL